MKAAPYLRHCAVGLFGLFFLAQAVSVAPVAQAFEVRYFTTNAAALSQRGEVSSGAQHFERCG